MRRFEYLIVVASGLDAEFASVEQLVARTTLTRAYQAEGLLLLVNNSEDVLLLPNATGFIIGKLFHRHGVPEQITQLSRVDAENICKTAGRHLIERYWGSYIAAIRTNNGYVVVRDPSGGLSCYFASQKDCTAFASDGPILIDAGLFCATVDWDAVGRILYQHQLPPERMALSGMYQLHAGCALTLRQNEKVTTTYWIPWDHIECRTGAQPGSSSDRLARAVLTAHNAWASCYPNALVGLSGGLDSSIVAICLAEANASVSCLTATTSDPVGDERIYAREVCQAIGAQLIECPYQAGAIDLDRSVAEHIPFPCGKAHEQSYNSVVRRAASRLRNDAFFVGAGGDNVFYLTHSARPLVDRYVAEGFSRGLISTLHDICSITGASIWEVIREAVRLARSRKEGMKWLLVPDYLHPDFVAHQRGKPVEHPWLSPPDDAPLGKIGHVTMLLRAMNHIEHRDKALPIPMISPLLSQPVVEICLSIQSWQACEHGVDRSVARRAFASSLPPRVLGRRGKGSPDGFVAQFIDRHRANIAERLLDGRLAGQGLLDRPSLEHVLRRDTKFGSTDCPRIMALLDAEAWANYWAAAPVPGARKAGIVRLYQAD